MFFADNSYLYYIPFILQGICAIHCIRNGHQQKWLWVIIVLPVIGCIAYLYSEVISGRRMRQPNIDVKAMLNPGVKYKRLEEQLRFSDTFANRIKLADAYLQGGFTQQAIELYEASLTGAFEENEHVLQQLIVAYTQSERYDDAIATAKKIYKLPQFIRSRSHILYAIALEKTGNIAQAETEFKLMKGRYSYFEQRYEYALFLSRNDRSADAADILADMLEEQQHLTPVERKSNRKWFNYAGAELKKLHSKKIA
ncbi:PLDc N-terminal domain-containing protein [Mucilaginibacter sp. JRF]|uniref:PLDc N-terminal domain-containing protein n=1 Tax=Mucilaginibacter sp. JRF TaxID=2780088 RepID=UPI0018805712|nr:PLDc N-terminal domain-containing protein [Mucilaginibacter sp. JRF]MBE9585290.1 PLDc N-terminal domain-containing protein [Mucilaginibacter sp. JRF]